MAKVAKKYLTGGDSYVEVDSVKYALKDTKVTVDPGLWDSSNQNSGGWMEQGTSQYVAKITTTIIATPTQPTPVFKAGETYPLKHYVHGAIAVAGDFIWGAMDGTNDLKGGTTYAASGTSQGPCTGSMIPDDVLPASGS